MSKAIKINSLKFDDKNFNKKKSISDPQLKDELIKLFDDGKIKTINCLVGLYFKKRESNVFNFLYENIKERKQKIFANENHSKVTLLNSKENFYTIEGSANFTANPRIEQFSINNNKILFDFHKNWMDEIIK